MDKYIISYININNEIETNLIVSNNIKLDLIFNYVVNNKNNINLLELLYKYDIYIKLFNMTISNKEDFMILTRETNFLNILKKLKNIQMYIYKKYKTTFNKNPKIYKQIDVIENDLSIYNNFYDYTIKNDIYNNYRLYDYYIKLLNKFQKYYNILNIVLLYDNLLKIIVISLFNNMNLIDIDYNYFSNLKVYLLLNDKLLTINNL